MHWNRISLGLAMAIVLQSTVLCGMVVDAALPRWTGTEIRVRTLPVDPRSMFRGNYALLRYDFSRVPASALGGSTGLRLDDVVYVMLEPNASGLYVFAGASRERPDEGVFLRARVRNTGSPRVGPNRGSNQITLELGIEAYFAPRDEALRLERELRRGGVAVLMISPSGKAALESVVAAPAEN